MNRPRPRLLTSLVAYFGPAVVALPSTALAHERRWIAGGKYDVIVGWDVGWTFHVGLADLTRCVAGEGQRERWRSVHRQEVDVQLRSTEGRGEAIESGGAELGRVADENFTRLLVVGARAVGLVGSLALAFEFLEHRRTD